MYKSGQLPIQIIYFFKNLARKNLQFIFISCIKVGSAEIAQLVEQRIRNAWVVCSSHILGTIFLFDFITFFVSNDLIIIDKKSQKKM